MRELIGKKGEEALQNIGFTGQMVSMGHQACGALELWNYPNWFRDVIPQDVDGRDRHDPVDLPALERMRLEADRFFTSDFNEEMYTKKWVEWVNTTEILKDVLDRHYPEMTKKWMNSSSAFSVWDSAPEPYNPIPLYLRVPH
ncbi:alpha-dioxygenase 1-like [Olea europaea subsp. europaea]|uniref:Alpha-dioxygenase 1-like n=1 Tax=Olea europaea subsp. europaea TaxID=158383 RepID=A0A8S0R4R3_OLEEU|nr:alpha-dioxygenase 1-like [Olea europaea subsp. europaea]